MSNEEPKNLSKRVKAQDKEAFHTLYKLYFSCLYQYAKRFVYDSEVAKDLVQDAYFALWTKIDLFDPDKTPVQAYLRGMVKNSCLNYFRNMKIKDTHADKIIEASIFSCWDTEDMDDEMRTRLNDVLCQLSDKSQDILIKHFVHKHKVKDIAEDLGISESTVKTHLKRGMKFLRKNLMFILFAVVVDLL